MMKAKAFNALLVALMVVALAVAASAPEASAANPAIVQQTGNVATGATSISLTLDGVQSGDAIVVFEYFGTAPGVVCNYILTPTDSLSNAYRSLGCTVDGAYGGQAAYYVQSSPVGPADAVKCNFQPNAGLSQACYAFDVSNPASNIFVVDTGTGTGGSTAQVPVLVSAQANSLLLATVGFTGFCHGVTTAGQSPSGIAPFNYNPASACTQGYSTSNGLSGSSVSTVAAGSYQWVMDPPLLCPPGEVCNSSIATAWSLVVVQVPGPAALTTSTSYSNTITGWLVPDSAHFSASLILMIYPLMGLVAGTTVAKMFRLTGDLGVYFALGGLTAGAFIADLPVTSSTQPLLIPFAYGVVAALLTFLYWWNS